VSGSEREVLWVEVADVEALDAIDGVLPVRDLLDGPAELRCIARNACRDLALIKMAGENRRELRVAGGRRADGADAGLEAIQPLAAIREQFFEQGLQLVADDGAARVGEVETECAGRVPRQQRDRCLEGRAFTLRASVLTPGPRAHRRDGERE